MLNLILLLMAILAENSGNASIRLGMRGAKPALFLAGAGLLISYGTLVNTPSWTFGRTMGVYIALFFLVSQTVARVILNEPLKLPTLIGGALIVAGRLVVLLWRPA